jgi:outer membrane protein assembly factor BamD
MKSMWRVIITSRGAYLAAINRAQSALADYREVPALEEALYIMVRSYEALGMTQLRDDTRRVTGSQLPAPSDAFAADKPWSCGEPAPPPSPQYSWG